jgi:hypothetical protein
MRLSCDGSRRAAIKCSWAQCTVQVQQHQLPRQDQRKSAAPQPRRQPGLQEVSPELSEDLLRRSQQLYYMARSMNKRWKLPASQKNLYPSYSHWDDLTWAATWLCRANSTFCAEALNSFDVAYQQAGYEMDMSYNNMMPHASMLLMSVGVAGARRVEAFNDVVTQVLSHWMVRGARCILLHPAGDWHANAAQRERPAAALQHPALHPAQTAGGGRFCTS